MRPSEWRTKVQTELHTDQETTPVSEHQVPSIQDIEPMHRRHFIANAGATLAAIASAPFTFAAPAQSPAGERDERPAFAPVKPLVPIRARPDRIIDVSVCTRPFRATGPRIEAEKYGRQTIVHNYGHGGSGWSLSWGSAMMAVRLALATRETHLAIIGCGAIGLTSARVAQRAGLRVRIYCRERPPEVRSSAATGVWSPDSRICTEANASPAFRKDWEEMARYSFRTFQSFLGLPGNPVEWRDGYVLSDVSFDQPLPSGSNLESSAEPDYPDLEARSLMSLAEVVGPGEEASRLLDEARGLYEEKGNVAAIARLAAGSSQPS